VLKNRALIGLTVGATGALLALGAMPATAADTATVSVLHAVPDTPVDVYANGEQLLPDFQPGTLTDPLELPAGSYDIQVFAAGGNPDADEPAIEGSVEVPAGANATLVAHLGEDGSPTLTPFVNDTSAVEAGSARVTVRHTAAAPAVDVLAGGAPVFSDLSNPNEAMADLPAGTVSAAVALAGTTEPVIGPADVPVTEGQATIVYAVGSAEAGNLQVLSQTISGLHSAPDAVNTGTSGLAADTNTAGDVPVPLYALATAVAGAGGLMLLARRRQTA
jgi:hypothetical protein